MLLAATIELAVNEFVPITEKEKRVFLVIVVLV